MTRLCLIVRRTCPVLIFVVCQQHGAVVTGEVISKGRLSVYVACVFDHGTDLTEWKLSDRGAGHSVKLVY